MSAGAVIVGAGKGLRMGGDAPKCLTTVSGIPLLLLATLPFERAEGIAEIVLVVPPGNENDLKGAVESAGFHRVSTVIPGGARRMDSVRLGIEALGDGIDRVVIHDGARPLLSVRLLERFLAAAARVDAALVALPVSDTLHTDAGGLCEPGPDRSRLVAAQTPQGFTREILMQAYRKLAGADMDYTDEVSLVRELLGIRAAIVPGERGNIKITQAEDLNFYSPQLKMRADLLKRRGGES